MFVQLAKPRVRFALLTTHQRSVLFHHSPNTTLDPTVIEVSSSVRRDGLSTAQDPCGNVFTLSLGLAVMPIESYVLAPRAGAVTNVGVSKRARAKAEAGPSDRPPMGMRPGQVSGTSAPAALASTPICAPRATKAKAPSRVVAGRRLFVSATLATPPTARPNPTRSRQATSSMRRISHPWLWVINRFSPGEPFSFVTSLLSR